ncbi:cell wall hydrolase [Candidatus Woesearchaeota archaeon]|jgi:spore germination cell wall hydrolase CwlJ-like protein|nr:cell wall hydrolase [Candidatus Woesearchaeota archaeon]
MVKNKKLLATGILGLSLFLNGNVNANLKGNEEKVSYTTNKQITDNNLIKSNTIRDLELKEINGKYYSVLSPIKKVKSLKYAFETNNFYEDSEEVLMARLMLGEGEGTSDLEKIRIGYTAMNRVKDDKKRYGKTLKEVILKPYQFTAFEYRKRILKKPMRYNPEEFLHCLELSENLLKGKYEDPTDGATFYFNPKLVKRIPSWVDYLEKVEIKEKDNEKSPHYYYREPL